MVDGRELLRFSVQLVIATGEHFHTFQGYEKGVFAWCDTLPIDGSEGLGNRKCGRGRGRGIARSRSAVNLDYVVNPRHLCLLLAPQ